MDRHFPREHCRPGFGIAVLHHPSCLSRGFSRTETGGAGSLIVHAVGVPKTRQDLVGFSWPPGRSTVSAGKTPDVRFVDIELLLQARLALQGKVIEDEVF
jgi:hypothetical protein